MEAEDVNDQETLKVWLQNRPHEDAVWIAHRAAMRVLPVWASSVDNSRRHESDLIGVALLRALLTSGVGSKFPIAEGMTAAALAYADAGSTILSIALATNAARADPAIAARAAATKAALADAPFAAALAASSSSARAADFARVAASAAVSWKQISNDCEALQRSEVLDEVPLRVDAPNPFQSQWDRTCATWQADPDYAFWLRWYEAALAGNPPNWPLLHDIALIPNADWEQGITHIAGLIAIFEERYHLLRQIADLQEQLRDVTTLSTANAASPEHRSHNNPPDLINAPVEIRRAFTVITVALDDAKAELETPVPRPSVLRRAGHALLDAVKSILGYCAALGDIALKEGAKVVGSTGAKWAIGILAVSVSTQLPPLQSLARALLDFAQKLPTLH